MTTLVTLGGILLMLGFAFWWAVRTGKRLNQAESLKERVDKVANVNEFNRREDMESTFKKKIKTRFPILFKRAVEFQMLKARGRFN